MPKKRSYRMIESTSKKVFLDYSSSSNCSYLQSCFVEVIGQTVWETTKMVTNTQCMIPMTK